MEGEGGSRSRVYFLFVFFCGKGGGLRGLRSFRKIQGYGVSAVQSSFEGLP